MVYIAAAELILIAGLVLFMGRRESQHAATIVDLIAAQEAERADLLTRIQRPELVHPRVAMPVRKPPTPDEIKAAKALSQIGTVSEQ